MPILFCGDFKGSFPATQDFSSLLAITGYNEDAGGLAVIITELAGYIHNLAKASHPNFAALINTVKDAVSIAPKGDNIVKEALQVKLKQDMQHQLEALLGLDRQAQHTPLFAQKPVIYKVRTSDPYFVGREDTLQQIDKLLVPSVDANSCQIAIVTGLAGMGKSQVALRFCETHATRFTMVYLCTSETALQLTDSFRQLSLVRMNDLKSVH